MSHLLHLDPALPVVWRSPDSLQIGVDPPLAILDRLDSRLLPVLKALQSGISLEGYWAIASHEGVAADDVTAFLKALASALNHQAPEALPRLAITGSSAHLGAFSHVFRELGYQVGADADEAVMVAAFVMPASAYHPWLSDDVPHTSVILTDQSVIIGPRITPGTGPCLQCVWENHASVEPALVALSTQLSRLSASTDTQEMHSLAAWHTRELLRARVPGLTYRLDRYTRGVTERHEERSESCLCGSLT